jgi:hypothetical protein
MAPDILDNLDATTPLLLRVCARLQASVGDALTIYLQKHLGHSSHGSGHSSESELDFSEQDEDERRYSDDSRSAELEEWRGFQDTTFDSADRDGESEPALSPDFRPVPVPSSSGTPRPSL